jgi:NADPH-dependent curcumin reductase CurA
MAITSREIRLKSRPAGMPGKDNFELASVQVGDPGSGEAQVKNLWMSVDPYMRGRMNDQRSYIGAFELGAALQGGAIGEVTASNDASLKPGDIVQSMLGWREAFNAPARTLQKVDTHGLPLQAFLGAAGMPGLTAYAGLVRIAQMKDGDVVFVSGAAGAVGMVACQVAKLKGHTVIGSAGGPEKVRFLKEQLGVDHAIDYKAHEGHLARALLEAAPEGIDVYFDNVGGEHLEAALTAAKPYGRFALCGGISGYNLPDGGPGIRGLMQAIGKSLRLEGYLVSPHFDLMPAYLKELSDWIAQGRFNLADTVDVGIENAPGAFLKLFTGGNLGKMLVKLG